MCAINTYHHDYYYCRSKKRKNVILYNLLYNHNEHNVRHVRSSHAVFLWHDNRLQIPHLRYCISPNLLYYCHTPRDNLSFSKKSNMLFCLSSLRPFCNRAKNRLRINHLTDRPGRSFTLKKPFLHKMWYYSEWKDFLAIFFTKSLSF